MRRPPRRSHVKLQVVTSRTVYQVLEETARIHGDAPALHQPAGDGYLTYSWNQYRQAAEEIAAGLRSLGIAKGDIVALDSETRLEFYLADLGIMANGSIAAALYPSYPPTDLVRTIEATGRRAVFRGRPARLCERCGARPCATGFCSPAQAEGALTLDDLRALGREALAARSGTAGAARARDSAVRSRHSLPHLAAPPASRRWRWSRTRPSFPTSTWARRCCRIGPQDSTVAFLPSAHIAQRVVIELLPIRCGMPVTFFESLLKLPQDIRKVRPTILLAPPRMWERIYSTICTELRKRPAAARKAFYGGLGLALAAARYRRAGKPVPLRIRIPLKLADRLLFRKVRARFGGRLRVAASGAAPLSKDLAEFYEAIGMPLIEGYGLTEGGVATLNPLDAPKPGSIGKPLRGRRSALRRGRRAADQEPLPVLRLSRTTPPPPPKCCAMAGCTPATSGYADADGYIFITGRKKELIVSSTGKKIYPSRVESLFKMEPLISQVLLIGDRLPFLTALFTINTAAAEALKGMEAWKGRPAAEMAAGAAGAGRDPQSGGAGEPATRALRAGAQVSHPGARFLHRAGRADRHHEGAPHARHGELQRRTSTSSTPGGSDQGRRARAANPAYRAMMGLGLRAISPSSSEVLAALSSACTCENQMFLFCKVAYCRSRKWRSAPAGGSLGAGRLSKVPSTRSGLASSAVMGLRCAVVSERRAMSALN